VMKVELTVLAESTIANAIDALGRRASDRAPVRDAWRSFGWGVPFANAGQSGGAPNRPIRDGRRHSGMAVAISNGARHPDAEGHSRMDVIQAAGHRDTDGVLH
jgi:hypothetical protein